MENYQGRIRFERFEDTLTMLEMLASRMEAIKDSVNVLSAVGYPLNSAPMVKGRKDMTEACYLTLATMDEWKRLHITSKNCKETNPDHTDKAVQDVESRTVAILRAIERDNRKSAALTASDPHSGDVLPRPVGDVEFIRWVNGNPGITANPARDN